MKKQNYNLINEFMMAQMTDSAHDNEHIYRVLYVALDIATYEVSVDYDVLITACLLHDIGRQEQFDNPNLCHATVGAKKAKDFLLKHGFNSDFTQRVSDCIKSHRFRNNNIAISIEGQILFDADKIDVAGALGIARTLIYKGQVNEPLYSLKGNGKISDGTSDSTLSFFQEYKFKLEKIYSAFYTKRGNEIALERQKAAIDFYNSMLIEVNESYHIGLSILHQTIK